MGSKQKYDLVQFSENIFSQFREYHKRGGHYDGIVLHNCSNLSTLFKLRDDLQSRVEKEGLDCLVFFSPNGQNFPDENYHRVDVGWFLDNGVLKID